MRIFVSGLSVAIAVCFAFAANSASTLAAGLKVAPPVTAGIAPVCTSGEDGAGRLLHFAGSCTYTPNSLGTFPPRLSQPPATESKEASTSVATPTPDETPEPSPIQRTFAYNPPGKLHPNDPRDGRTSDRYVYAPNIIFPLALPKGMHPHMNSQIYGHGGGGWNGKGEAGGSECDTNNYDPFRQFDNYCEVRGWKMPLCPSGTGHQGLDIRPPTCADSKWDAVAVADGIITRVTSNTTVVLKANDGTSYYYLHMNPRTIRVKRGDNVRQGDVLGKVSKYMGGKKSTTTHLHFMAMQNVTYKSKVISTYIPIYTSLIAAYRKAKGLGPSIDRNGDLVVDANFEIGAKPPELPVPAPEPEKEPQKTPEPTAKKPPDKVTEPEKTTNVPPPSPKPPAPENKQPEVPAKTPPAPGPDTEKPPQDLAKLVLDLRQELNELKVTSQRDIENARGEANASKAALLDAEEKLKVSQNRIAQLETKIVQNKEAADKREEGLKSQIDDAAVKLEAINAKLAELERNQRTPSPWTRITKWWKEQWR